MNKHGREAQMSDDQEDIFRQELPWPKSGDMLFVAGDDWQNNACVNWAFDDLHLYARGYKLGADALVERIMESGHDQDFLVYPIVFLYRQYLELRMKSLIRDGRALDNQPPSFTTGHQLDKLWLECRIIIERVWPGQEVEAIQSVEDVIKQLSTIDPQSMTFRYPVDKKGNRLMPPGLRHINVRILAEVMNRTAMFLDSADQGVAVELENKQDFEAYLRETTADEYMGGLGDEQ
jgi:hypothetical protein